MELRAKLAQKKLKVILATGSVPKNGRNEFNKYDYATAADTFEIIRKALAEGIAFGAEVESVEVAPAKEGGRSINTKIWMRYTLTDTETGYAETVRWPGEANDTGDKGLYKAQTNCLKYFCFQTFMLPTGLDVEQDDHGDERNLGNPPAERKPYGKGKDDFYGRAGRPAPALPATAIAYITLPPTASALPETADDIGQTLLDFNKTKAVDAQPADPEPTGIPDDMFGKDSGDTQKRVFNFLIAHYRQFDTAAEKMDINKLRTILRVNYAEDMKSSKGVQRILKGVSHPDISGAA